MNSKSSLVDKGTGVLRYAVLLSIAILGYQILSGYFIAPYLPVASTFTLVLFPVFTYLLFQHITLKHFDGTIRPVPLFISGMLLHWLSALCVSGVVYLGYQFEIDLYNTGTRNQYDSFITLSKGFLRWYSIFGLVSSPLGILILYAKSTFGQPRK